MMIALLLVGSMVSMSSCGGENVQTESTETAQDSTTAVLKVDSTKVTNDSTPVFRELPRKN